MSASPIQLDPASEAIQAAIRRLRVAEWLAGHTRSRCTIEDLRAEGFEVVRADECG